MFDCGLQNIFQLKSGQSRSINWENRNGEKGKGGMASITFFSSDLCGGAFCPHFVVLGALFAPIFTFWGRFLPPH